VRRLVVFLLLLLYGLSGQVFGDTVDDALARRAAALGEKTPRMRIGLDEGATLRVAGSGFRVIDPVSGADVWRDRYRGELRFVAEDPADPAGASATSTDRRQSVFRVQVAAFGGRDAAEAELEKLTKQFGVSGVVREDVDRGNWRVRLGESERRAGLQPLVDRLRVAGLGSIWIAEEPLREAARFRIRLVDESYASQVLDLGRVAIVPIGSAGVKVEDVAYRGLVEVRTTGFGTLQAINWIHLERYLRGVVPAELGPEVWPELEALKAQAVAARTYAWANRNQFADRGFDICFTPRCQVYKGLRAEHPLSDRALSQTRGEVLVHGKQPIDAKYTATCGGHTENGGLIFPEHLDSKYLTGVPCRAEEDAMASLRGTVVGRDLTAVKDETGRDVSRDHGLLVAAGVLKDGASLRDATRRLASLAGRPAPQGPEPSTATLGASSEQLLRDLGLAPRLDLLVADADVPALLRDAEVESLPATQQRALAYLVSIDALSSHGDGRYRAGEATQIRRLVPALARLGESYKAFRLKKAVVSGLGKTSVRVIRGKSEVRVELASSPTLLGWSGGHPVPVDQLELWPGDRIRYRTDARGAIDFLELRPPVKGTSDDRSGRLYKWQVRKTRRQLERTINRRLSIGTLKDLKVIKRGVSGRVVELELVGSSGSSRAIGFDVRRVLDLREILTVIEIQRATDGSIEAVLFTGKGWGHGVGMCQVGAYGMALRGAGYRKILAHYYRGTEIEKIGDFP